MSREPKTWLCDRCFDRFPFGIRINYEKTTVKAPLLGRIQGPKMKLCNQCFSELTHQLEQFRRKFLRQKTYREPYSVLVEREPR